MKYRGESYSDIGAKLKALRTELGMTQKELSDGIVTRNMLSRIENGEALPSLSTLSALATRLSVPIGYLIDDRDDGTKLKNERLLNMIKKEYSQGNYELCLQYLRGLEYYQEERDTYKAKAMYCLGVEKMNKEAPVKEAQKLISDSLKSEALLDKYMLNEGKAYRALLDGFAFAYESGKEEDFISRVHKFSSLPCDIAQFSTFIESINKFDLQSLGNVSSVILFENVAYSLVVSGIVALKSNDNTSAFAKFAEAYGMTLPSPIRCYLLTLLEKSSAAIGEFEKAYSYMTMRKSLVKKLLKKD